MVAVGQLGRLPELRGLDISYTAATAESVVKLSQAVHLEELSLEGLTLDSSSLQALAGLRKLHDLKLPQRHCFYDAHLRAVAALPLRRLSLASFRNLQPASFAALANMGATLSVLDLSNTLVNDASLASLLPRLSRLSELSLARTKVGNAGLAPLGSLLTLKVLDLSRTMISNPGALVLARLANLHTLNLAFTRISTRGVRCLRDLPYLHRLNLRGTWVRAAAVHDLLPSKERRKKKDLHRAMVGKNLVHVVVHPHALFGLAQMWKRSKWAACKSVLRTGILMKPTTRPWRPWIRSRQQLQLLLRPQPTPPKPRWKISWSHAAGVFKAKADLEVSDWTAL